MNALRPDPFMKNRIKVGEPRLDRTADGVGIMTQRVTKKQSSNRSSKHQRRL